VAVSFSRATKRIEQVGEANICTSIIVAAEPRYGCAKKGSKRLLKAVEDLLSEIEVLVRSSRRRRIWRNPIGIRNAGRLIAGNDLLIAADACAIGATIVTANTDELRPVRGLKVENWLS